MATFCQHPLTCKVKKEKGGQYARLVQRTFERTGMNVCNVQVFWEGHKNLVKSSNKVLTLFICTQHFNIFRCNLRFFSVGNKPMFPKPKLYDKLNFHWWHVLRLFEKVLEVWNFVYTVNCGLVYWRTVPQWYLGKYGMHWAEKYLCTAKKKWYTELKEYKRCSSFYNPAGKKILALNWNFAQVSICF